MEKLLIILWHGAEKIVKTIANNSNHVKKIVNGEVAPNLVVCNEMTIAKRKTIVNASTLKSHAKNCKWRSCSISCGVDRYKMIANI